MPRLRSGFKAASRRFQGGFKVVTWWFDIKFGSTPSGIDAALYLQVDWLVMYLCITLSS